MAENMETQTNKSFMVSDYGDNKLSKEKEINASMTIADKPKDEYTRAIENIGGNK